MAMLGQTQDLEIVLRGSATRVERWCKTEQLVTAGAATTFATLLTVPAARRLIRSVDPLVHRFANLAQLAVSHDYPTAAPVFHLVVATVVASPWFGSSGSYTNDLTLGLTARFRTWIGELDTAVVTTSILPIKPLEPVHHPDWRPISGEAITYIAAAALDGFATESQGASYLFKLERIQSILGLKPNEMTRLLGVSHEGLRKWARGGAIAEERLPDIDDLYDFSLWLSSHVKPEAVPAFVRRRIPALLNERPIDWLMTMRLRELRAIYEKAFSYEQLA
jgi:hypothetical protein